jgi:hypothetical protein
MNARYAEFWKSIEPRQPEGADRESESKRLGCSDLPNENLKPADVWAHFPCIHVEMDLLERFTRIVARPAVLLKEDRTVKVGNRDLPIGYPRLIDSSDPAGPTPNRDVLCDPADHACTPLLPQTQKPRTGWQLVPPIGKQSDDPFEDARKKVIDAVINKDGKITNDIPYAATPADIAPIFGVPPKTILLPDASSSASTVP